MRLKSTLNWPHFSALYISKIIKIQTQNFSGHSHGCLLLLPHFFFFFYRSYSHTLLYYSLFIFCFLFPLTKSLTFNLTNIGQGKENFNITTFGDAYISPQGLQITSDQRRSNLQQKASKATYVDPLPLWSNSTGNLTDFNTHFTFVIDSAGNPEFADGLTFFLAPDGSNFTPGGAMGLPIDPQTLKPTSPFVAVEFDTYRNLPWDPVTGPATHVGINVNSLTSNVTAAWYCNIIHGIQNEAWIKYDSSSMNLSVVFTSSRNTTRVEDSIHLIVDLREHLPELVTIGFSAATGSSFETNNVKSWEFSSSLQINVPSPVKKISPGALGGLVVGSCVSVGGLALVGFVLWRRSREKEVDEFEFETSTENKFESSIGPKKFSYGQLSRATNNFEREQKLGEGGFGKVYSGFLGESNSYIAVKRISKQSKQEIKEYASKMNIVSQLRHRNLVQLIGWCHDKKELLLVYEFMENDSLDFHLFDGKSLLTWRTRYKIAQGLASALLYLHEGWEQCVVHGNVKSSNVMLDSNFNAKLGDFGLVRFVHHEKVLKTTIMAGTLGYVAPECVVTGKASKESDVYSFGIVALEIACGRKPFDLEVPETQRRMVEWVWNLYGIGKLLEAVDPKLSSDFDEQEMEHLMIVGLWCAHPDHNFRPTISQAIHVLNFKAPLPNLPPKLPPVSSFSLPLLTPFTTSDRSQNQNSSNNYHADSSNLTSSPPVVLWANYTYLP